MTDVTTPDKATYQLDLNHHLIGRKLTFVYEGGWRDIGPKAAFTVHATYEHNKVQMLIVSDDLTGQQHDVTVEEALFSYSGEDNPLFVFTPDN